MDGQKDWQISGKFSVCFASGLGKFLGVKQSPTQNFVYYIKSKVYNVIRISLGQYDDFYLMLNSQYYRGYFFNTSSRHIQ